MSEPTTPAPGTPGTPAAAVSSGTVEALVRAQLAKALGGRRGMVEAAVPTLLFTIVWLTTRDLQWAIGLGVASAAIALVVRLVQRSTIQFCVNALVGIGIGWLFVALAARNGGDEDAQALAYFLPGLIYNAAYAVGLGLSCVVRWPLVGFVVGSVTGDPTAWHADRQVVRLCTTLTWVLAAPCVVRVVLQGPLWLGGHTGAIDADVAIGALGVLKIALGWPLQLAVLGSMLWLLGRDRTPVEVPAPQPAD